MYFGTSTAFSLGWSELLVYSLTYLVAYYMAIYIIIFLLYSPIKYSNNLHQHIKLIALSRFGVYPLIISISSLLGMPPLAGFVTKILVVYVILVNGATLSLILALMYIVLSMFFYIQVLKFIKKTNGERSIIKIDQKQVGVNGGSLFWSAFLIVCVLFCIIFFIFFIKDLILVGYNFI